MADLVTGLRQSLKDVCLFSQMVSGIKLRQYQQQVAAAIVDSVVHHKGLTFVVIFPRQSGKNELQAQIETFILTLLQRRDAEIVKVSPTWKPQSLNAMRRLERILKRNLVTRGFWSKEQGYIYRIGQARIFFLSAAPTASIVGATASTLLECDEAQDVDIQKWDKEIAPMAASTNATRVFWGTAWTSQTLLAREKRLALEAQKQDGIRRVFEIDANLVGKEVPAYKKYVESEVKKHGRNNPAIRTQYFSEEIDECAGMFPADRIALMQGEHLPCYSPQPGKLYAFTIDVGGEDFRSGPDVLSVNGRHDSTVLTVFEIDLSAEDLDLQLGPRFLTVYRKVWTGIGQVSLYRQITALAQHWQPQRIVVDATGVGEGLASFLMNTFRTQVIPFKFTQASKSALGWSFISLIETGRYKEYCVSSPDFAGDGRETPPNPPGIGADPEGNMAFLQGKFYEQASRCTLEVLSGPGQNIRWSVPEGTRSFEDGEPLHDDLLLSAALSAALLEEPWGAARSLIIDAYDPLSEMRF